MNEKISILFNKIDKKYKVAFVSTFVMGLLSHGMALFNKYSYHDDINSLFSLGATISSGRWMLELLSKFDLVLFGDGHYSLPTFNGLIALLFVAFSACIIIKLLDIKNYIVCIIISSIMVCFPTMVGFFGYTFTLTSYMFGLLLCTYGSYIICAKCKWYELIIGIILVSCSIGIYQAFIPTFLSLIIFYLIHYTRNSENEIRDVLQKTFVLAICVLSSAVFYFGVNKLFLAIYNEQLSNYQGINNAANQPITEYLWRLLYAYEDFLKPMKNTNYFCYFGNTLKVYYIVMLIGLVLLFVDLKRYFHINKTKTILLMAFYFFIPATTNFIFVMSEPSTVHILMTYGQTMLYVFVGYLLDNVIFETSFIGVLFIKISLIVLFSLTMMFSRFDNQCYLKAEFTQQEAISYFNTMITQIKSADGYKNGMPVCLAFMTTKRVEDDSITKLNELDYFNIYPYDNLDDYLNNYAWRVFMEKWCGFSPKYVSVDDIVINDEILNMPCYPDSGSIKVVNDIVVVKY